ncbi:MAG: DivIVA domain-containing protein [Clostridiales bacterium]|jgi:cell division septum initiation protein DivIVA|nr:DivIVA domain-containing protein [Clostridiales bacterium]
MNFEIARKGYKREQVDAYIKQLTAEYENGSAEQRDRIFELKARLSQFEKENAALRGREAEVSRALLSAVQKSSEIEDMALKKYDLEIQRLKLFHIKWQAYFDDILARYPLNDELQSIADFTDEMRGILGVPDPKRRPAVPKPNVKLSDAAQQHEREKKRLAARAAGTAGRTAAANSATRPAPSGPAAPIEAIHKYLDKNARSVKADAAAPVGTSASMPMGAASAETASASARAAAPVSTPAFSLEDALNPTEDIADILKELGIE